MDEETEAVAHKRTVFQLIKYEPTEFQWSIHSDPAPFRVIAAGVRFGKSYLAAHEAVAALLRPNSNGWIVTPEHSLGKTIFELVRDKLRETPLIDRCSDRDQYIKLKNGSQLYVKSAANKTSLMGASLDFAIVDEASRVDEEAMNMVRLRLLDRQGWFIAISTPNGRNWFYNAYLKGQDHEAHPEWRSWNAPTWANPFIDPKDIEERRQTMPERHFAQDIEARFLDDDGAVFKNIHDCATVRFEREGPAPVTGRHYAVSADLGRHQDYTAVLVWDVKAKAAVHFEWFQGDWTTQIKRIKATCVRYGRAPLVLDATGEGDAVHERMTHENATEKFSTRIYGERLYDPRRKREIVEALMLAMENREVAYVNHPRLLRELGEYEFHRTRGNSISYGAPSGHNDDGVMSLALGWSLVGKLRSTVVMVTGRV